MKKYILLNRTPVVCDNDELFISCFGGDRTVAVTKVGDAK